MAVSTKKAVLVRFDREPLPGYVNPQTSLGVTGVELMTPAGSVTTVSYDELKAVCFVREFSSADALGERRAFAARPKVAGLWVKLEFRDGESLEGHLPNNLLAVESAGIAITPPDSTNSQRIFVPRSALRQVQVLGVIGSPLRPRREKKPPEAQIRLFE